jgi:hypothetical protein
VTFSSIIGPAPSQIESLDPLFVSPTDPIRTDLRLSTELFEKADTDYGGDALVISDSCSQQSGSLIAALSLTPVSVSAFSRDDPADAPPPVCASSPASADAASQAGYRPRLSLNEFTPPADQICRTSNLEVSEASGSERKAVVPRFLISPNAQAAVAVPEGTPPSLDRSASVEVYAKEPRETRTVLGLSEVRDMENVEREPSFEISKEIHSGSRRMEIELRLSEVHGGGKYREMPDLAISRDVEIDVERSTQPRIPLRLSEICDMESVTANPEFEISGELHTASNFVPSELSLSGVQDDGRYGEIPDLPVSRDVEIDVERSTQPRIPLGLSEIRDVESVTANPDF